MFLLSEEGALVLYDNPEKTWSCRRVEDVLPALEEVQTWVDRGFVVLGFLTYGASPAFDGANMVIPAPPGSLLAYWEAHRRGVPYTHTPDRESPKTWISPPLSQWSFHRYSQAFQQVREALLQGDTYQVNLTMGFTLRLLGGEPTLESLAELWIRATDGKPGPWQALCCHPEGWILSLSPELFFHRTSSEDGGAHRITCRPMKGTRPRGSHPEADRILAEDLLCAPKDRAENLMITDMIRNDLGKSALPGTVKVPRLFALESYPTVHQMVSEVTARSTQDLTHILKDLFPCASITGAPKVRTMELIADLEETPRGMYTGALGRMDSKESWFNVAIRTLEWDLEGKGTYRAGGGVVWDSVLEEEWEEIQVKTRILSPLIFPADLVETMKWTEKEGFFLGTAHWDRLQQSCRDLGFPSPPEDLLSEEQERLRREKREGELRVRLVWTRKGQAHWTVLPLDPLPTPVPLMVSPEKSDTRSLFFRYKTTCRDRYNALLASAKDQNPLVGEVLIRNHRDRITEGSFTNLAYLWKGKLYTPPGEDGLLRGLYRNNLLDQGQLEERPLEIREIPEVEGWWIMNSVRGMLEARLLT